LKEELAEKKKEESTVPHSGSRNSRLRFQRAKGGRKFVGINSRHNIKREDSANKGGGPANSFRQNAQAANLLSGQKKEKLIKAQSPAERCDSSSNIRREKGRWGHDIG